MENHFKGPGVVCQMAFWHSEFLGVIDSQGNILKFDCQDGSSPVWGLVGEIITVLESAVQLDKVETRTFTELRHHLLSLHKLNKHKLSQRSGFYEKYLNEVFALVDSYWDRLLTKN